MDLSFFSANPQSLTLIPCNLLSSTGLCSVRREFLGGKRHLRSPPSGLRAKRTSNKLGFLKIRPAPFRCRAALNSHSALIVGAVVTFSAVSVVYFNHYQKRKKVSELRNFSLSHLGRDFLDRVIEIWVLGLGDLHKENSVKEHKALKDTTRTDSNIPDNKVTPMHVNISAVIREETHVTETEDSSGSHSHPSSANGSVLSNSSLMHTDSFMTRTVDSADSNLIPSSYTLVHEETLMTTAVDSADSDTIPSNASLVHEETTLMTTSVDSADSDTIPSNASLVHEETLMTITMGSSDSDMIPSNGSLVHEGTLLTKTDDSVVSSVIPSNASLVHEETLMTTAVDSADADMIPSNASLVHEETLITKTVDSVDSNVIPSSASLVHEETLITKTVDPASSYVILSTSSDSTFSSSTLMHEESLITKTVDSTGSDANDFIFSNESQVTDSSSSPVTSESGALQHLTFPEEMSNMQQEGLKDERKFKHELEKLMSESNGTVLNNALEEGTKDNETKKKKVPTANLR